MQGTFKIKLNALLHQRLNPSLAFLCIAVFHFGIRHNETDNVWITNVLFISSYLKLFTCATKVRKLKLREKENEMQQLTNSYQNPLGVHWNVWLKSKKSVSFLWVSLDSTKVSWWLSLISCPSVMAFFSSWFYSIALSFYDFFLVLSALPMRTRGVQAGIESQELCEVVDELVNGCSLISVQSGTVLQLTGHLELPTGCFHN